MYDVDLQIIRSGYDRETCWTHARPGVIPGSPPIYVVTMSKLLDLTYSDFFGPVAEMRSDDGGKTWTDPVVHSDTLGFHPFQGDLKQGICDFVPAWHAKTGVLLGTATTVCYGPDDWEPHKVDNSAPAFSVYDVANRSWSPWAKLELPNEDKFKSAGAGSVYRYDLPNGDILQPISFRDGSNICTTVLRCSFDGKTIKYLEHGSELTLSTGMGFCEPSLAYAGDRYFLTLRNVDAGYVTCGDDGVHFDKPMKWTFDNGSELGNYNTQQHWLTHGNDLYLVYTRRGANNDHVMRHRAPLFMALVDKDRLCVIRDTERIVVPERGARLGNFGVACLSEQESLVVVSEWMQTKEPKWWDTDVLESYGSDNSVFVARIHFS